MSLLNKAFLVILFTSLAILGVIHFVQTNTLEEGFTVLEGASVRHDVRSVERAVENELDALATANRDWGWWDESARFVRDGNPSFESETLTDLSFRNLGIDLVLFVDASGRLVFGRYFEPITGEATAIPSVFLDKLGTDDPLIRHTWTGSTVKGLMGLPDGKMLVSSCPILGSDREGPIQGTLLFGRYLDKDMADHIAYVTDLPTTVWEYGDSSLPESVNSSLSMNSDPNNTVILPENEQWISGYAAMRDLNGSPVIVLQVRVSRGVHSQGDVITSRAAWFMAVACIVLGLVNLVLLRRMVLLPVSRLVREMGELGRKGDAKRLSVLGRDEIARVAVAVNKMLDSLERTRQYQRESDRRYLSFIENAPEGIVLVDVCSKKIILANPSFANLVECGQDDVLSLNLDEVFPLNTDDRDTKGSRTSDNRSLVGELQLKRCDGSLLDVDVIATEVVLDGQEIVCLVVRDIGEKKRTEEVLRHRLAMEELIATLSTRLINVRASEVYPAIERVLADIGQMLDASRIFVSIISPDGSIFERVFSWVRPGLASFKEEFVGTPTDAFTWTQSQVMRGESVLVSDIADMPPVATEEKKIWMRLGIKSIVLVPVFYGNEIGGVLGLDAQVLASAWTKEDARLLNVVGQILENLLARKRAEEALEHAGFHDSLTGLYNRAFFEEEMRRAEVEGLYPITVVSTDVNGLKLVNDTMGHLVGDQLLKAYATILKKNSRQTDVVARVGGDEFAAVLPRTDYATGETICRRLEKQIEKYNQSDPSLPLSISWGLQTSTSPALTLEDAFRNADANMYQDKLRRATSDRRSLVDTLLTALATKDHVSQGHTRRVRDLALSLSRAVNLSQREISDLSLLAEVHDIGKVGIPDQVLFKNGPLDESERLQMREHAAMGYKIAVTSPALSHVAELILHHHEWWNGAGYPDGLKGEEIPLLCRIVAIADAFDAMTSDRPYRKSLTVDKALVELSSQSGRQFDPSLVDAFVMMQRGSWTDGEAWFSEQADNSGAAFARQGVN